LITMTLKLLRHELQRRGWWPSLLACFDPLWPKLIFAPSTSPIVHIATFGCTTKIGSYRGKADIKRVLANDPDL
jgi:hypothetical protein